MADPACNDFLCTSSQRHPRLLCGLRTHRPTPVRAIQQIWSPSMLSAARTLTISIPKKLAHALCTSLPTIRIQPSLNFCHATSLNDISITHLARPTVLSTGLVGRMLAAYCALPQVLPCSWAEVRVSVDGQDLRVISLPVAAAKTGGSVCHLPPSYNCIPFPPRTVLCRQ